MRKPILREFLFHAAAVPMPRRVRRWLLRLGGVRIGPNAGIASGLQIAWRGGAVNIGAEGFINRYCFIDAQGDVTIEDHVHIANHVRLITSTHEPGTPQRRAGRAVGAPVRIGAGSWLGAGVTVLPGVTIGTGCVIAAGAVVTRDCLMHGLYAGIPAKRIKELPM